MPAPTPLYQEVYQKLQTVAALSTSPGKVRKTSIRRLALLVTGILAAQAVTLAKIADELLALSLTQAATAESIVRTLERILSDRKLDWVRFYEPALRTILDWEPLLRGSRRLTLVVDESSQEDKIHLLRLSLPYWGHSLPLAWELWPQNQRLAPQGEYWVRIEAILARAASLIPAGLSVTVLADRAYDVPGFVDRVAQHGWHWAVRYKANGSGCFRDHQRREWAVKTLIQKHVPKPGSRWKARGWVFKDAGWYPASIVACWQPGEKEPLVVISDLPPRWDLLRLYGVRFWIETGFRSDKKLGWHWEESQVRSLEHHHRLVLAMAWASLITLCLGLEEAKARLTKLAERRIPIRKGQPAVGKPRHAGQSLFTMGLRRLRDRLYQTTDRVLRWLLTDLDAPAWGQTWYHYLSRRYLQCSPQTVLP